MQGSVKNLNKQKKSAFMNLMKRFFGATGRIRTGDLLITNQLLYRLSHGSISRLDFVFGTTARNIILQDTKKCYYFFSIYAKIFLIGCSGE